MLLNNLIKGKFIKRYKRFLMDVEIDVIKNGGNKKEIVTVHTPNTGTMKTLLSKDNFVYLEKNNNPHRKLKYTAQIIEFNSEKNSTTDGMKALPQKKKKKYFCLINTHLPNHLVQEAIRKKQIKELINFTDLKTEVVYGQDNRSRIDILLEEQEGRDIFIEVKNATLRLETDVCAFPDAPTKRGRKHLQELALEVKNGNRAVGFFLVSRNDCRKFRVAKDIDPLFFQEYLWAKKQGVEFLAYKIGFKLTQDNSFDLNLAKKVDILD